jgi:hypothetical protein
MCILILQKLLLFFNVQDGVLFIKKFELEKYDFFSHFIQEKYNFLSLFVQEKYDYIIFGNKKIGRRKQSLSLSYSIKAILR